MLKRIFWVLPIVISVFVFWGAEPAAAAETVPPCPICEFDYAAYDGPLTQSEIEGLLLALNDEYQAQALYGQVITDFGAVRPFTNIRRAEYQHASALIRIFRRYDLPVPANPWPGKVPSFSSVSAACEAAVEAEIVNRDLYENLFESTDRADITRVYSRLQWGSEERHLPAFEYCSNR